MGEGTGTVSGTVPGDYAMSRLAGLSALGWPEVPVPAAAPLADRIVLDIRGILNADPERGFKEWSARTNLGRVSTSLASFPRLVAMLFGEDVYRDDFEAFDPDSEQFEMVERIVRCPTIDSEEWGILAFAGGYQGMEVLMDSLAFYVHGKSADHHEMRKLQRSFGGILGGRTMRALQGVRGRRNPLYGHPNYHTKPLFPDVPEKLCSSEPRGVTLDSTDGWSSAIPGISTDEQATWDVALSYEYSTPEGHLSSEPGEWDDEPQAPRSFPVRDALDTLMAIRDCLAFLAYGDADRFPPVEPPT